MEFRIAEASDLQSIIKMLALDPLGTKRERYSDPLEPSYLEAFDHIERDPNNEIIVAVDENDQILGFLQLTFIPNLTYRGSWRAQIEGVRVHSSKRSEGIGKNLVAEAIDRAKQRGCRLVQLTSDKTRADALRFYESLGFKATHEGFKLSI